MRVKTPTSSVSMSVEATRTRVELLYGKVTSAFGSQLWLAENELVNKHVCGLFGVSGDIIN